MIVLGGASASGKTEVAKMLASKYGIVKAITTTTRAMRTGEVNGKDYFFVTKEKFEEMIKNGEFVEHTIYNGNLYGSTKSQVADNKCVVIDPAGLKSYLALNNKKVITFFLDANEKVRHQRMCLRGDKPENIKSRIEHDRIAFKKENIPDVDFHINVEIDGIEEITDRIYNLYIQELAKR